jgi:VanZ family protein
MLVHSRVPLLQAAGWQPRHFIRSAKDYNRAMRHKIFVGYVAFMLLAFLLPVPTVPLAEVNHVDKLVHFGVFLGFALLLYLDRASTTAWMLLISFAFAGGIELVQGFLPYRDADWWDFLAGAAGAGLGVLLVSVVEAKLRRRARKGAEEGGDPPPPG